MRNINKDKNKLKSNLFSFVCYIGIVSILYDVAIASTKPIEKQPITISVEALGIIFGGIVSLLLIIGTIIQATSKVNDLKNRIIRLEEELKEHRQEAGHQTVIERVDATNRLIDKIERTIDKLAKTETLIATDKKLDLHLQDYINNKDAVLLVQSNLEDMIKHKFHRCQYSIRDIQRYLQKEGNFVIREHFDINLNNAEE